LKFGSGAGWERSVAPIVCEMKVVQSVKEKKNVVQTAKRWKASWIGHLFV